MEVREEVDADVGDAGDDQTLRELVEMQASPLDITKLALVAFSS